ncbi:MAG: nucleotidyltransferase domain-containing protein [Bacteriovoracaceae bacterium]
MKLQEVPLYEDFKHLNIIMLCVFGSKLYGTSTPDSDQDFKGIYIPNPEDVVLGKVKHSIHFKTKKKRNEEGVKNSKDDVDIEILSLQYFVELACKGETMAIDMLHISNEALIHGSTIWFELYNSRKMFYTKCLDAFVEYGRKQAAKYGIKGSRLHAMRQYLEFIDEIADESGLPLSSFKLKDVWDNLPRIEHVHFHDADPDNKKPWRMIEVCGQCHQETANLQYIRDAIQKKYDEYGERARKAEANEGIDWKAISHAMRASYQLASIYRFGDIYYPLMEAPILRACKQGKLDYLTVAAPMLEDMIGSVEKMSHESTFPEKVDKSYWDSWVVKAVVNSYLMQK